MEIYTTTSGGETQKLGEKFAKNLKPPKLITLISDLGGGKTTFTQGLAKGLGIKEKIISPTFILERIYSIPNRKFFLYHYDLYRIEPDDVLIDEILENMKDNIVIIEWAEKINDRLPNKLTEIKIEILKEDTRKITIDEK